MSDSIGLSCKVSTKPSTKLRVPNTRRAISVKFSNLDAMIHQIDGGMGG